MPLLRYLVVPSIVVAFAVAPAHQTQSSATLAAVGEDGTSRTFSAVDLAALPQTEVRTREADSSTVIFRGPAMTLRLVPLGKGS